MCFVFFKTDYFLMDLYNSQYPNKLDKFNSRCVFPQCLGAGNMKISGTSSWPAPFSGADTAWAEEGTPVDNFLY